MSNILLKSMLSCLRANVNRSIVNENERFMKLILHYILNLRCRNYVHDTNVFIQTREFNWFFFSRFWFWVERRIEYWLSNIFFSTNNISGNRLRLRVTFTPSIDKKLFQLCTENRLFSYILTSFFFFKI